MAYCSQSWNQNKQKNKLINKLINRLLKAMVRPAATYMMYKAKLELAFDAAYAYAA